ncbi:Magnesium-dependent phosphatase 1 [Mactra antiquata]
MASTSDEERDTFDGGLEEDEERDVLPDMYEHSDAGDTMSTSECRSVTSEERSLTPDELDDIEEMLREQPKPKVIVFDLDYTLWPFWVDRGMNIELPFKQVGKTQRGENKVCDATGREVKSFPDITPLLQRLHTEGYKLGIASEAFHKDECAKLVKLFGWDEYIDYQEIYPGSKIFHFVKIKKASGVEFCDMLYFDDEKEHLAEVAGTCTGITTCWADRGVSEEIMEEAFLNFAKNRESSTYFRSKPVTISRRNSTEPFVSLRPLINLRRRNSVENDIHLPPANSVLGGASLAALASDLSGLSMHEKPNRHQFNPNLPGLNGPIGGAPRSKTRRRYSIM